MKFVDEDAGGDGGNATRLVARGRGFVFPISADFDPSGGAATERRLLSRSGRLPPLDPRLGLGLG